MDKRTYLMVGWFRADGIVQIMCSLLNFSAFLLFLYLVVEKLVVKTAHAQFVFLSSACSRIKEQLELVPLNHAYVGLCKVRILKSRWE
jgi:hypothetical protein